MKLRLIENGTPMHARDAAKLAIEKYRDTKPWKVNTPVRIHDEDEIVSRGTRPVDQQFPEDRKLGKLLVAGVCFVLALLLFGLFDFVR